MRIDDKEKDNDEDEHEEEDYEYAAAAADDDDDEEEDDDDDDDDHEYSEGFASTKAQQLFNNYWNAMNSCSWSFSSAGENTAFVRVMLPRVENQQLLEKMGRWLKLLKLERCRQQRE